AGWRQQVMMSLIYFIAFLCLLQLDEVLRIEICNLRGCYKRTGKIELMLDFCKTHQAGGKLL
ncbi:hypothetical protein K469DRAFT_556889, partial [Zopfia rhizophila CBS 207.26]